MIPPSSDGVSPSSSRPQQIRLAVGDARWSRGGGEFAADGLCDYVVTDDGSGQDRRWRVRVPLTVTEDGTLEAGAVTVEEMP